MNDFQFGARPRWIVPLPEGFCLLFIVAMFGLWIETRIENVWLSLLWVIVTSFATGSVATTIAYQGGRNSNRFAIIAAMLFIIALIPVRMWVHSRFGASS